MSEIPGKNGQFESLLTRLTSLATEDYYNPYKELKWPDSIPLDRPWMSPDLMTIHGTGLENELNAAQIIRISRWESINFYSLNVHGIRELLIEVVKRIHTKGFELPSDFFHHFIGEENEHMWFFAEFCLRYGGKIYVDKRMPLDDSPEVEVQNFLVFARILIFEEIVDYFNLRMSKDADLHPTIREINRIHHQDESRHIAFGRQIVALLYKDLRDHYGQDTMDRIGSYLDRYMEASIGLFYNPLVYKDAGLEAPYEIRAELLKSPARKEAHRKVLKRTRDFFIRQEITPNRSHAA